MTDTAIVITLALLVTAYFLGYDCGSSEERRKQRRRDWWRNHE